MANPADTMIKTSCKISSPAWTDGQPPQFYTGLPMVSFCLSLVLHWFLWTTHAWHYNHSRDRFMALKQRLTHLCSLGGKKGRIPSASSVFYSSTDYTVYKQPQILQEPEMRTMQEAGQGWLEGHALWMERANSSHSEPPDKEYDIYLVWLDLM